MSAKYMHDERQKVEMKEWVEEDDCAPRVIDQAEMPCCFPLQGVCS